MLFREQAKHWLQSLFGGASLKKISLLALVIGVLIILPLEAWWRSTEQTVDSSTPAGAIHVEAQPAFQILPGRKVALRWEINGASEAYLNDSGQSLQGAQKIPIRDYCTETQTLRVVFADGTSKTYPITVPILIDNVLLVTGLLAILSVVMFAAGYYLPLGILSRAAHKVARLNWTSTRPGNPAFVIAALVALYVLAYYYYVMQPNCQTRLNLYALSGLGRRVFFLAVFMAVLVGSFSIIGLPVRTLTRVRLRLTVGWQQTLLAANVMVFGTCFWGNKITASVPTIDALYSRFFPLAEIFYLCWFASAALLVVFLVLPQYGRRGGAVLFRLPRSVVLIGVIWFVGSLSFPIILRGIVLSTTIDFYLPFLAVISLDGFVLLRASFAAAPRPILSFGQLAQRWTVRAGLVFVLVIVWAGLWYGPWAKLLGDYLWLRTGASLILFMLPGVFLQQIIYVDEPWRLSRALTVGFVMSVGMTGLLGGIATLFAWPFLFVKAGLFVLGAVFLTVSIIRRSWTFQVSPLEPGETNGTVVMTLLGLVAFFVFSYVPYAMTSFYYEDYSDYRTYNAQVTNFEESDALNLNEIFLGTDNRLPSRFWLSFWPLSQAVMVNLSGLHILILFMTLSSMIVGLSLLSTYALARSLGFSSRVAWLAVIAQTTSLTFLMIGGPEARAGLWLTMRSLHDKTVAAFVLVPILFLVMSDFLTTRRRRYLILFGLAGLALLFTHPVMLAVASMIAGLYGLIELAVERGRFKQLVVLGLILAMAMSPALYIRVFSPDRFSSHLRTRSTMRESIASRGGDIPLPWQRRFNILDDGRFFGFNPELVQGTAFTLTCMGGLVALFYLRKARAARYICAALLLVFLGLIPFTGWLIAEIIAMSQLIRLPMIIPFGISIAFLFRWIGDPGLRRIVPAHMYQRVVAAFFLPVVSIVLLINMINFLEPQGWLLADLGYLYHDRDTDLFTQRRDLVALGDRLEELIDQQAVVLANSMDVSDLIASLSGKTKAFYINKAVSYGGITRDGKNERRSMFRAHTTDDERLDMIAKYDVEYVIVDQRESLLDSMMLDNPDLFALDSVFGNYSLYVYEGGSD